MDRRVSFLSALFIVLCPAVGHAIRPIPAEPMICVATKLKVRAQPRRNGREVGLLEKGTKVYLMERSREEETIDGIKAPWIRISGPARTPRGWVFGGYLDSYVAKPGTGPYTQDFGTLFIKLLDGRVLEFHDVVSDMGEEDPVIEGYRVIGFIERSEVIMVDVDYYEGSKTLFVHRKTGKVVDSGESAIFSPNQERFMSVSFGRDSIESLAICSISSEDIVTEINLKDLYPWVATNPGWVSPEKVRIELNSSMDPGIEVPPSLTVYLSRVRGQWALEADEGKSDILRAWCEHSPAQIRHLLN